MSIYSQPYIKVTFFLCTPRIPNYFKLTIKIKMDNLLEKLEHLEDDGKSLWGDWNVDEKRKLIEMYYIISKKESQIWDLIYSYHGCDSWEDIFRDYSHRYLKDKADGVKVALDELKERQTTSYTWYISFEILILKCYKHKLKIVLVIKILKYYKRKIYFIRTHVT
jgi:hypothetical protein